MPITEPAKSCSYKLRPKALTAPTSAEVYEFKPGDKTTGVTMLQRVIMGFTVTIEVSRLCLHALIRYQL